MRPDGIGTVYGLGATVGALLPYERRHELEADHIGLMLMAKAGHDPREAIAFWQEFSSSAQGKAPPDDS